MQKSAKLQRYVRVCARTPHTPLVRVRERIARDRGSCASTRTSDEGSQKRTERYLESIFSLSGICWYQFRARAAHRACKRVFGKAVQNG